MKNSIKIACAVLCTAFIGTAALADSRPDLTVAVPKNPSRLDPMAENSNVNVRVIKNILETLIRVDYQDNSKLVPGLAESWSQIDGSTMEFKLRKGVTCHNGEAFDASDVAFTFGPERFMGENAPGFGIAKQFLSGLEKVEEVDSHTVRMHFKAADPLMDLRFSNWMTEIICKDAFIAAGSWESWLQKPVGTGPYKIGKVMHGDYIRIDSFDGYWDGMPPAKSINFKIVPEIAARIAGLKTAEFDVITEISPDQFDIVKNDDDTKISGGPIRNIRVIIYDEKHPLLKNPKMRQAMSFAIDRQLIVEAIYQGLVSVPNGLQMKVFGDLYIPDHKSTEYDPAMSKKLLKEAGYKGEEISYRYLQDYYTGEVDTAQILAEMWRAVGINVKLELKENWGQIEDDAAGRGVFNWSNTAEYPDPLGQIYRLYGPEGWFQTNGTYESAEFNEAAMKLKGTDKPARIKAMREMLEIYERSDPPGTFLHTLPMFYGVRSNIDWKATDTAFMDFSNNSLAIVK